MNAVFADTFYYHRAHPQFDDSEPPFSYTGHTAPQGAYNSDWPAKCRMK